MNLLLPFSMFAGAVSASSLAFWNSYSDYSCPDCQSRLSKRSFPGPFTHVAPRHFYQCLDCSKHFFDEFNG